MILNEIGIHTVSQSEAEQTALARAQTGWRVFGLPADIATKDEFFEGVRHTFPLDPALNSNRSWDALSDSLWSGLDGLRDERIVIVWPGASRLKSGAPEEFDIAMSVLADLSTSLASAEATLGSTKRVLVLVAI